MKLVFNCKARYQLRLHDAISKKIVRAYPWRDNLINDIGLNNLASGSPANAFIDCAVGSSNSAASIPSGAITFIQAGTNTITASNTFFTSAMVGGIIKFGSGTGGYEQYIATIGGGGLTCTVQASPGGFQTVTGVVATVWLVQTENLTAFLYNSNSYLTGSGDCGTAYSAGTTQEMQRTYYFAPQTAAYTVNEVGWSGTAITGPAPVAGVSQGGSTSNNVFGRTVVSSVTVGTANFLSVVIQLSITYAPASPSAVANVNTNGAGGALNTAGNAMIEYFGQKYVASNGGTGFQTGGNILADDFVGVAGTFALQTAGTYTQQTGIFSSGTQPFPSLPVSTGSTPAYSVNVGPWTNVAATTPTGGTVPPGTCQLTFAATFNTNGETVYGLYISGTNLSAVFDIKLTTPFVLPVGTFPVSGIFQAQYSRTLSN